MERWHSFEPTKFFPEPLERAVSALDDAYRAAIKAGKLVDKALTIAQKVASKAQVNPAQTALRALLQEIDRFVSGIAADAQAHAIIIPIRNKVVRSKKRGSALEDFLDPQEPAYAYVQRAATATSGSEQFFAQLAESVADGGDMARPQFPSNYAVTGACVLASGETLADLQVPLRLFTTLFRGNMRMPLDATATPVAQNVRVRTAALPGGVGVVVQWDPLPPINTLPLLTGERVLAEEIFVIQIRAPFTKGWYTWSDLFTTEPEEHRDKVLPSSMKARCVARVQNNGFVTSYTDSKNLLNDKDTYYYATCVRYSIDGTIQPMGLLSNVVRVPRVAPQPTSRQAVPPDWYATLTLTEMFPPLQSLIEQVRFNAARLTSFTMSNSGVQQLLQQNITQIRALHTQWQETVEETQEITERLRALTALDAGAGIHATTITRSTGGMNAWLAELARRLSDTTDASTPQISSQAVVLGFVIVAGAPRLPDLSAITALFELFFGRSAQSPVITAIQALNGPVPPPAAIPAASQPVVGYTPSMRPSTTPTC